MVLDTAHILFLLILTATELVNLTNLKTGAQRGLLTCRRYPAPKWKRQDLNPHLFSSRAHQHPKSSKCCKKMGIKCQ